MNDKKRAIYTVELDTKNSVKNAMEFEDSVEGVANAFGVADEEAKKYVDQLAELNAKAKSSSTNVGELAAIVEDYKSIAIAAGNESVISDYAIQQAAELKLKLDSTNQTVDALAKKGQNLNAALELGESVTAGYQGFIGVTALVGEENENLLETITKLEAAQGIFNAIQTVRNNLERESILMLKLKTVQERAGLALIKAKTVATGVFNGTLTASTVATKGAAVAQRVLNIAMKANPIGLLIVGITALIAVFAIFNNSAADVADQQEELADKIDETNAALERQNKILDEQAAAAQNKIDNTQKLLDGEIKYLQAIKNRSKEEEATLGKKLAERQANEIKKIDVSITNAENKTKQFKRSFVQQFNAIDLAIKATDIEDGVNDINYDKVRAEVAGFKTELFEVLNSDIGAEEKARKLQILEKQYGKTTAKLNTFKRSLGSAEQEEFAGVLDGFKVVGGLIDKNRGSLNEYNKLVTDKKVTTSLQDQDAKLEAIQKREAAIEEARRKADKRRQAAEARQKAIEEEKRRIEQENRDFAARTEDIKIMLINDSTDRELEALSLKYERELNAIKSNSDEANALREELFNQYVLAETEIQAKADEAKLKSQKELSEAVQVIRLEYAKSGADDELNQLNRKYDEEKIKLQEALDSEAITIAEYNEIKLLQQQEFKNKEAELNEIARQEELARDQKAQQEKKSILNSGLDFANNAAGSLINLSNTVAEANVNSAKGNEEKQEQIRKKAFERNKKLQITAATIQGFQGVINAITAPSLVPEPFGSILKGVNAAFVAGSTLANIRKIKSTTYSGGGGGGSFSTGGGGISGGGASELGPRNLTDIRTGLNDDGTPNTGGEETGTPPEVILVEHNVTKIQKKVKVAEDRSTY